MPTSDEPRAAPLPGAYAGHQMIELEWKALTEAAAAVRFGLDEIQRGRIMVQELG